MSQQDAAKEQANTRKNVRVVSILTAAACRGTGDPLCLAAAPVHASCPVYR